MISHDKELLVRAMLARGVGKRKTSREVGVSYCTVDSIARAMKLFYELQVPERLQICRLLLKRYSKLRRPYSAQDIADELNIDRRYVVAARRICGRVIKANAVQLQAICAIDFSNGHTA